MKSTPTDGHIVTLIISKGGTVLEISPDLAFRNLEKGNNNCREYTYHTSTVDERSPPLGLLDKVAEIVRFVWEIQTFNTTFRCNAT